MGIYIPKMDMPSCCGSCEFGIIHNILGVSSDYGHCGILEGNTIYVPEKRLNTCPLIEVPEHGPLKDADEMLMALDRAVMDGPITYAKAREIIINAPKIIDFE